MKAKWSFPTKKKGSTSKKKKVEYSEFTVVKMGCNKCTAVFYSEGGYHDHLYRKHRIKNVSKYLPTILNKIWQHLPALPKAADNKDMHFACKERGTKFYEKGALETHEGYCWKLSAEDREIRAQSFYKRVEEFENQKKLNKIGDKKKDRGRSKTPKKEEAIVIRKRSTTQQSQQKLKSGAVQKPANTKTKDFTNKPVTKKYPLQSNKEIEDVEKLLAKYKTTNKKPKQTAGKVESSTDVNRSVEELDDTKNDSNYDLDNSTSGSSEQLTDNKFPLPTIRRPKTRSMKTEIMATQKTPESDEKSSDAFEIIKRKCKNANAKEET